MKIAGLATAIGIAKTKSVAVLKFERSKDFSTMLKIYSPKDWFVPSILILIPSTTFVIVFVSKRARIAATITKAI